MMGASSQSTFLAGNVPVAIRMRIWNSKGILFRKSKADITKDADDLDYMRMGVWNVAIGSRRWHSRYLISGNACGTFLHHITKVRWVEHRDTINLQVGDLRLPFMYLTLEMEYPRKLS